MNWQVSLQLCTDKFSVIQLVLRIAKIFTLTALTALTINLTL